MSTTPPTLYRRRLQTVGRRLGTALIDIDWIVANDTVCRPDVSVVCGGAPEGHIKEPPAIAVEVLSPSTRERDLTFKRDLYASSGVTWYLILDPETKTLTALRREDGSGYREVDFSGSLPIDICDSCSLSVRTDQRRAAISRTLLS